jgi:hypothetical protein
MHQGALSPPRHPPGDPVTLSLRPITPSPHSYRLSREPRQVDRHGPLRPIIIPSQSRGNSARFQRLPHANRLRIDETGPAFLRPLIPDADARPFPYPMSMGTMPARP